MSIIRSVVTAYACTLLAAGELSAKTTYVPIVYRETSGTRPYVRVELNGKPFLFMVHGNASFNAMTTHSNAKAAGIRDLVAKGDYGITETGVKSKLGRSAGTAETFSVGGVTIRRMPIDVFEIPQAPPVDGMAGLGWLRQAKVMVDYSRNRLAIPAADEDAVNERARLKAEGYVAVPMTWDAEDGRYLVTPSVNGVPARFVVSTVASVMLDEQFARAQSIKLSEPMGKFGGPTGTTGDNWETIQPYDLRLDRYKLIAPKATVYDLYAYNAEARPAESEKQIAGYLGCDFMIANKAVIDFGSGTLFLKVS